MVFHHTYRKVEDWSNKDVVELALHYVLPLILLDGFDRFAYSPLAAFDGKGLAHAGLF